MTDHTQTGELKLKIFGNAGWYAPVLLAGSLLSLPGQAPGQQPQGVKLKTGASELEIGGRVQTQFNTTTVESEPESQWLLRRVRLEAKVKINDVVSGKVQPDFAGNRVSLKDAYLKLTFAPALELLAGRAHRPFSLIELTSSARMPTIERGVEIRGVDGVEHYELIHGLAYSDRDIGLQVMGAPTLGGLAMTYAAGLFAGPAASRLGTATPAQYAARLTVEPLPDVRLGAAWSGRGFAHRASSSAPVSVRRGNAFEVDLELGGFDPGLHLVAELAAGDVDPFAQSRFTGAQAWLGYRTAALSPVISGVEPMLRVSDGDVEGGALNGRGGTLVTPGVSLYFGGWNRVMVNYDLWSPQGGDGERSFKAMFQMVF